MREADAAYCIGGAAPRESYLNIASIIAAARASSAEAVHPGYGFLAENAEFAQAVLDAGIVWVGPSPDAIRAMGDKANAKGLAKTAGVPILESFEPEGKIDYPIMIKAVAGGGGGSGALAIPPTAVPGGVGGYASASGDGTDGATVNGYNDSGLGAVGATPGTPTTQAGLSAYGGTGGVASVAPDGTITPGVGGNAGVLANFPVAQGGGGYAGGGGGSAEVGGSNLNGAGAGGGGSGFLAAGLTASATTGNIGAGSITFTYTFAPTITAPATSVAAGSTSSTTVSGMPESTAFTVLLTGTTQVVGSGTTDASGDPITVPFTLPAGTSVGVHSLTLQVGSTAVATSPTFTVSALTLAATGVAIPSWAEPGAATAIVFGMLLLGLSARRRRARAEAI